MNILYISPMEINRNMLDGVARKILAQVAAFESYSNDNNVFLASYFENKRYLVVGEEYEREIQYSKRSSKQLELFEIYPKLEDICCELDIGAVYFRISSLSWVTNKLFRNLNKKGIKIVVEIPTYPFWKEKWMDVKNKLFAGNFNLAAKIAVSNIVYFIYAQRLKKHITAIVTFSDIKSLWGGIPVIGITNGYEFDEVLKENELKKESETLNLLMVASIRDNHGVDRVIKGISSYLRSGNTRNVVFHVVGDGEIVPSLKRMVSEEGIADSVIFYGFKSGDELDEIYRKADIGVSALGFHRLGVFYASPLKSKEYFAKGLPVVGTTVEHDVLASKCKVFYFSIPENDTALDIKALIEFYDELRMKQYTNRVIVDTAKKCFEWKTIMEPVYQVMQ